MHITRIWNTRYRNSTREKPLSREKPSSNLPLVDSNENETIQDPFDLDKDLLQSPSQTFLHFDVYAKVSKCQLPICNFNPKFHPLSYKFSDLQLLQKF